MTQIADKLRWYRYQQAMLQSEAAGRTGNDRRTCTHYEEYGRDYYPIGHMQKPAELYGVPVESLLDDDTLFLFRGRVRMFKSTWEECFRQAQNPYNRKREASAPQNEYDLAARYLFKGIPLC